MRRTLSLTLSALLLALALAGCADGKPAESPKTPEEMTAAYKAAIE